MSPTLAELQALFAAHIVSGDRAELVATVRGDAIPAAARLRVYRHHVLHSLAAALGATFSTVQALVGEDFFRAMARSFVAGALPTQPVLAEYGAGFAGFVDGYEPARQLPYLGDVARLDWALNLAFHVPFTARLDPAALASLPAERLPSLTLTLAPGSALIASDHPLDRIWQACQPGASGDIVDLAEGAARLLVMRRPDDAGFVALDAGEAALVAAIAGGGTMEEAALAASATCPSFDLSSVFARLLGVGVFAALQQ